jgi:O-antigen/teichoic acid export membrane protein
MIRATQGSGIIGRIVRAASAQTINQIARVAQLFVLVPVCLDAWGTSVYEDWVLLNSIAAFFPLADMGFGQLISVKLIESWSKGDRKRFDADWANALGLACLFCVVLGAVLSLLSMTPSWTRLIPTRQLSGAEVVCTAVLLLIAHLTWVLLGVPFAAYRARGDLSRSYHVSSILAVLHTIGIAAPAALGKGPAVSALGNCSVTVFMLGLVVIDVLRRYPDMFWRPVLPPWGEFQRIARTAIGYLVFPVTTTVMLNGPNLILAAIGAPQGAIALFTTSRTIAGVARQLPYQFAHPTGVELASLLARGDWGVLLRLYSSASRALAMVVGGLSGFVLAAASLVLTLWTHGKVGDDPVLMALLVGTTAICAPSQVAFTMLWYGGFPTILNKALFLATAVAMGLALLLGKWWGVRGVACGLGVGEILGIALYLPIRTDRLLLREGRTGFLQNIRVTLLSFLSSAGVGYLVLWLIEPYNWLGLIELGLAWTIPAAAAHYWLVIGASQRTKIMHSVADFVRSRRAKPPIP